MKSSDILLLLTHHGKLIFKIPKGQYDSDPVTYCIRVNDQGDQFTHSWWTANGSSWGPHNEGVENTMKVIARHTRHLKVD